jgi:CubicO group peptidase (beta-lactamase class C family)
MYAARIFISSNEDINTMQTPENKSYSIAWDAARWKAAQYILDSIFIQMVAENHFNGSLLIAKHHRIIFAKSFGYADFYAKRRINDSTVFELASVSKQFTAISILMLYEEHKLSLTDDIQQYVPHFPYSGVTIHHLLCHRSGVPEYFKFADHFQQNKDALMDNDSLLRMLKYHFQPVKFAPDSAFEYTNTGYAVLATIVEKVSGKKFADFVKERIFQPVGMKHTVFYDKKKYNAVHNCAYGHRKNESVYKKDYLSGVLGDKGIFSTAYDMFLFNNALDCNLLLKEDTKNTAFEPQNVDMDECQNYGYGWRLGCDLTGKALVYHGGLWNGNNTLFVKRLEDEVFIIILSNIYNKGFSGKSSQLLQVLDGW